MNPGSDRITTARDSETQKAVAVAIEATERHDYEGALKLFRLVYEQPGSTGQPVSGLSHYGLCVLKVERKAKRAIDLAERARKSEFYDARHWANLVRIYLDSGSRRRAVSILHEGLEKMPDDPVLLSVRDEMGYRRPPAIPFLHRDNPINIYFGKNPFRIHLSKPAKIAIVILWFALLMAGTFYFLMKSSGF